MPIGMDHFLGTGETLLRCPLAHPHRHMHTHYIPPPLGAVCCGKYGERRPRPSNQPTMRTFFPPRGAVANTAVRSMYVCTGRVLAAAPPGSVMMWSFVVPTVALDPEHGAQRDGTCGSGGPGGSGLKPQGSRRQWVVDVGRIGGRGQRLAGSQMAGCCLAKGGKRG